MIVDPDDYRYIGALLGAASGLLFVKPKSIVDAVMRFAFSFIAASILYFVVLDYMAWAKDVDHVVAAAWITGFASWPIAGFLIQKAKKQFS